MQPLTPSIWKTLVSLTVGRYYRTWGAHFKMDNPVILRPYRLTFFHHFPLDNAFNFGFNSQENHHAVRANGAGFHDPGLSRRYRGL